MVVVSLAVGLTLAIGRIPMRGNVVRETLAA
jgi:hypothetical protein